MKILSGREMIPTKRLKGKMPEQRERRADRDGHWDAVRKRKRGWRGRESGETTRDGGWILLVCTGSRRGPERPLRASTMSDHINVAASSFLSLHTHGLVHTLIHTHTHTDTTQKKCLCTNLEKCLREILSLNLNLSPPFILQPLWSNFMEQAQRSHTHTHSHTHVYPRVKREEVSMFGGWISWQASPCWFRHTYSWLPSSHCFLPLSLCLSLTPSNSIMCDPVQLAAFLSLFHE